MKKRLKKKHLEDVEMGYCMLQISPIVGMTFAYIDPATTSTSLAAAMRKIIRTGGIFVEDEGWRLGRINLWTASHQIGTYDIPIHVRDEIKVVNVRKWINGELPEDPDIDEFMTTLTADAAPVLTGEYEM